MTFVEMFSEICERHGNKAIASRFEISEQYVCDLRHGRRMPSLRVINAICDWMGRGPKGRREWHVAAAKAHGWEVQ